MKNPSPLGIGRRRHSGECRNPEPRRMATLRFFIPHSLAGIQKKQKNKGKVPGFRHSPERRSKARSKTTFPHLAELFGASLPREDFFNSPHRGSEQDTPLSCRMNGESRCKASAYRLPPKPAEISLRSRTPPIPSCRNPKKAPVTTPSSPPVRIKVLPRT